jgi:serine/threonine protein kinase
MSTSEIHNEMELPEGVREGTIVSGKYLIGPVLGAGAMGIVVLAQHLLLNQDVAIKFLVAGRWDQADAVQRFVREARAAIRIQSEHVVRVLDVAVLESGAPYIVMEHLKGKDLATRLRVGGPLPVQQAVDLLLQACEAISESHRIGIIHRDLKPANLFVLERDGAPSSIKVLDFGISKSTRLVPRTLDLEASAQITEAKAILGSPFYMSPEQMESARDVDARTDIWALGVTLFEMLTGRPPFVGPSLVQIYSKMTSPDERGWRVALEGHPPGLAGIIGKCLEWDRERRYATVRDLAGALAAFGSKRAGISLQRIMVMPDPSESNPGVEKAPVLTRRRPGRLQVGRNLIAATLAGFLGSAVFLLASRSRTAADAPAPSAAAQSVQSVMAVAASGGGSAFPSAASLVEEPQPFLPMAVPVAVTPAEPLPAPARPPIDIPSTLKVPRPSTIGRPAPPSATVMAAAATSIADTAPSASNARSAGPMPQAPASAAASSFIPDSIRALLEKRE